MQMLTTTGSLSVSLSLCISMDHLSILFIAQLKPGNTKDGSGNHCYTIPYYFEENAATSSFNKDSSISVQNQFLQAEEQNSEAGSSGFFF